MSAVLGWVGPLLIWAAVTWGGRRLLVRFGLIRCRLGDWGTAFLLGFSLYTIAVYLGALAGIPIRAPLMIIAAGAVFILGYRLGYGRSIDPVKTPAWTPAERVVLLFLCVVAGLTVINALFYPITAMDAHSYDGRAKFMVADGKLDLDLYHWPGLVWSGRTNITYPPLFSLGLATTYALGGWQSKMLTALFSLAWPLLVYGALRVRLPRFWSLIWTLLAAITPEVFAHASFCLLNVPAMGLITATAISWARFLEDGDRRWLAAVAILAAGASGVRADAMALHLAVAAAAGLMILLDRRHRSRLRSLLPPLLLAGMAPLATWGTWVLYMKFAIGMESVAPMGSAGGVYGMGTVLSFLPLVLSHFPTYGPVFYVWAIAIPITVFLARRYRLAVFYHLTALFCLGVLVMVFGLLNQGFGGTLHDILNSSLKRAVFYVVPLALLGAALSPPWIWLARVGSGWLYRPDPRSKGNR